MLLPYYTVRNSVDIVECINMNEYKDLSDDKKSMIDLIISAGFVNMNSGSVARNKLANAFPAGTTTNTNLSNYIGEAL